MTLRDFCMAAEVDPVQWNKIERGALCPPTSDTVLHTVAKTLGISDESESWKALVDLASLEPRHGPKSDASEKELANRLPLFLRTNRNEKPTEEELRDLADLLRHG